MSSRSLRLLLVTHPPLEAESGAAQVTLNLAAALAQRGHDARAWSPEPLPSHPWWSHWRRQRHAAEAFAAASGPWDVIDTPAIAASRELARHGRLIARSVQPEMRYLLFDVTAGLRRPTPRAAVNALLAIPRAAAIHGGWRRSARILCLGSSEYQRMRRRFPAWRGKLGFYRHAPAAAEQRALAEVRRRRGRLPGEGTRFLWIGRWSAQKGTRRLLGFFAHRLKTNPHDRLTIAGCGAGAARDVPRAWQATGRVRLLPAFSRQELPALLAEHDAGLFTSTIEGWGLTLNEMLESGLPVYATEAGAVPDLRPHFPRSLRPFPPPQAEIAPADDDPETSGYYDRFTWPAIAEDYERQTLGLESR